MKRFIVFASVVFALFLATGCDVQIPGVKSKQNHGRSLTTKGLDDVPVSRSGNMYALLIGVDDYAHVSSLHCCVNDMNTLKDALLKIGFKEDNIQMLVTGGAYRNFPTKKAIEQKLSDILSTAQSSDMVFIAFSGHGAQNGKKMYFCPPDSEFDDLEDTCISITKVMKDIEKCPARFKWVVVDACRNDPTHSRGAKGLRVIPAPPAGIALFQSCAEGELSYEEENGNGNGYFTKNFVAALSGEADSNHDGRLTLYEVCAWTTEQTKSEVKKAQNVTQRPYLSGSVTDFILTEDVNVPKAKALADEAQKAMDNEEYSLAIERFNAAIDLFPKFEPWKRERELAKQMMKLKSQILPSGRSGSDAAAQHSTAGSEPIDKPLDADPFDDRDDTPGDLFGDDDYGDDSPFL